MTYVYEDSTVVLGALSPTAEPHSYDLCANHAQRITAPRGWNVLRLCNDFCTGDSANDDITSLAKTITGAYTQPSTPAAEHKKSPKEYEISKHEEHHKLERTPADTPYSFGNIEPFEPWVITDNLDAPETAEDISSETFMDKKEEEIYNLPHYSPQNPKVGLPSGDKLGNASRRWAHLEVYTGGIEENQEPEDQ